MSYFCCPNCNHVTHIFGKDGVTRSAQDLGVDLLGDIPLNTQIMTGADQGRPIVVAQPDGDLAEAYLAIADKLIAKLP
jgi:ATP-binding protein involved in chromosome partitioning